MKLLRLAGIEEFKGSQATEEFILLVDELFDRLNCRLVSGSGTKAPLSVDNLEDLRDLITRAEDLFFTMCTADGKSVITSSRYTGIMGLVCAAKSLLNIGEELLGTECNMLLAYNLCQDHLELFFNAVRRSCKLIIY